MVEPIERKVIQDPNAKSILEAGRVQGGGIMSPKRSDMSQVGKQQREFAEILGFAADEITKYQKKKEDEWRTEGIMKRAAGEAEEEVRKSGNRFTMDGYLAMDARTNANVWFQSALSDIENGDKELTPDEYQKKLSTGFKQLKDSVKNNEYATGMLSSLVEQQFPQLVAQQVKSNNTWREGKTKNSYTGLLVTELQKVDPTDPDAVQSVKDLTVNGVSGLSEEAQNDAIVDAIDAVLDTDNADIGKKITAIFGDKSFTKMEETATKQGVLPGLTSAIMSAESRGKRFAKDGSVLTSPKGAKGEMQVMDSTNLDPGFGVRPAADNSLAERARVGVDYVAAMYKRYGSVVLAAMAYNAGPGNVDAHLQKVGNPLTAGGPTMEQFVKTFPLQETRNYAKTVVNNLDGEHKDLEISKEETLQSLMARGLTVAQSTKLMKSYDNYTTRMSNNFDENRILTEQRLVDNAKINGNLAASLQEIRQVKEQNNYSDAWANGMATKVQAGIAEYEKGAEKRQVIESAIANNTMNTLSGQDLQDGIKLAKARIATRVQADPSIPDDQKTQVAVQETVKMLAKNDVVDSGITASIGSGLSGKIIDDKGAVRQEALQAYSIYLALKESGGVGYAEKYIGANKDIIHAAETYATLDPATALLTANNILTAKRENPNWQPPKADQKEIQRHVNNLIDEQDVNIFSRFYKYSANRTDVLDQEVKAMKSDTRLNSFLTDRVNAALINGAVTVEAATNQALAETAGRVDIVAGNVVFSGKQSSIAKDMGLGHAKEPTIVNAAFMHYMRDFGETLFGPQFKDSTFQLLENDPRNKNWFGGAGGMPSLDAIEGTIQTKMRGVPNLSATYDPELKGFLVDVYTNMEKTTLLGSPKFIPAAEIGDYYNQTAIRPRDERMKNIVEGVVGDIGTDAWTQRNAM